MTKKNISIHTICKSCNKEFEIKQVSHVGFSEMNTAFENCPNCGERNDTWLRITLNNHLRGMLE